MFRNSNTVCQHENKTSDLPEGIQTQELGWALFVQGFPQRPAYFETIMWVIENKEAQFCRSLRYETGQSPQELTSINYSNDTDQVINATNMISKEYKN